MGVPAFFRWLTRRYSKVIVDCKEDQPIEGCVDATQPNPNGFEIDNLYLDMNGIIHPCCHPENEAAPETEREMILNVFKLVDRLFNMARPRQLLYMGIDGVAPRAKINQQRSRRFRAAKDSREKAEREHALMEEAVKMGRMKPEEAVSEKHWDSNVITPGTPFMDDLATALRLWVLDKINTDPAWKNIKVVFSDSNIPGEGEHKMMEYIRLQRNQPGYDPNTHHCLCGLDADLIMLGLATHELHFDILREVVFMPNETPKCYMCGRYGHTADSCMGEEGDDNKPPGENFTLTTKPYQFLRLNLLREYLNMEYREAFRGNQKDRSSLPFGYDIERIIDDFVLLCFFVGNDFLPHLPSLEIREGAIDALTDHYKSLLPEFGGYLSDSGEIHWRRVDRILKAIGESEDDIFRRRKERERRGDERDKRNRERVRMAKIKRGELSDPDAPGAREPSSNKAAARALRQELLKEAHSVTNSTADQGLVKALENSVTASQKNSFEALQATGEGEGEPEDEVKLWEAGWKQRYYATKFHSTESSTRQEVAKAYCEGLAWVLKYYYQGCVSWGWFYPYHYAPFASCLAELPSEEKSFIFEKGAPFEPLQQLMAVLPAASAHAVPPAYRTLMTDPASPIIHYYPEDFPIDLNGKKKAWQGVALLPFIEEGELVRALAPLKTTLTPDETRRNSVANQLLYASATTPVGELILSAYRAAGCADIIGAPAASPKKRKRSASLEKQEEEEIEAEDTPAAAKKAKIAEEPEENAPGKAEENHTGAEGVKEADEGVKEPMDGADEGVKEGEEGAASAVGPGSAQADGKQSASPQRLEPKRTGGMSGTVEAIVADVAHGGAPPPLPLGAAAEIYDGAISVTNNQVLCAIFRPPQYPDGFIFKAKLLPGVSAPKDELTRDDYQAMVSSRYRGRGRGGGRGGYRGRGGQQPQRYSQDFGAAYGHQESDYYHQRRTFDPLDPARRMIKHAQGRGGGRGGYSHRPAYPHYDQGSYHVAASARNIAYGGGDEGQGTATYYAGYGRSQYGEGPTVGANGAGDWSRQGQPFYPPSLHTSGVGSRPHPPSSREEYPPSSRDAYPPSSREPYPPSSYQHYPPSSSLPYPPPPTADGSVLGDPRLNSSAYQPYLPSNIAPPTQTPFRGGYNPFGSRGRGASARGDSRYRPY